MRSRSAFFEQHSLLIFLTLTPLSSLAILLALGLRLCMSLLALLLGWIPSIRLTAWHRRNLS